MAGDEHIDDQAIESHFESSMYLTDNEDEMSEIEGSIKNSEIYYES